MSPSLIAISQVVLIDVTLAGDNAIVVALAVAGLQTAQRRIALIAGLAAATLIRLALSVVAISLLRIIGLTLAGGLLLLWVCWKMFRELRSHGAVQPGDALPQKTIGQAVRQIMIADLSMSLDNVLAVAGASRGHIWIMAGGLALSVALMAIAASALAKLLERQRWIAWLGLAVVLYVAMQMIVAGSEQVAGRL